MRAVLIRGVCSLCAAGVKGAGADEFEALGDAETEHFAATLCLGEPTEIEKGVRQSNGREVFPSKAAEEEIKSFASAFKSFRLAGVSMEEAAANARRLFPPPLPAPDPDLLVTVRK